MKPPETSGTAILQRPWLIVAIGALVGFVVSLTSIGKGSVTLPLLAFALPGYAPPSLDRRRDRFRCLPRAGGRGRRASFGNVNWAMAAGLVGGSLPGV